ncbi:MAG TPA: glycosyltransferase family 4 protein [Ignavibacteria bacterium]|nr:hypothetical protein [Bacteroidota bacterium]HRE10549.1 glycosyltransferase family 4 protein [Ignavibacteria bacterium]HRF64838.1 glycosyltransferase family 4 protein [Ignavibacteria bacterium]HRJ04600.1 glycosyltransferase family 4 protein [Ignavibacteria bacterium]
MKINFIVPVIVRSGGIRVIFEFANRLTDAGNDVILYTPIIPFNTYKPAIKKHVLKHQLRYALEQWTGKAKMPADIFKYRFKIKAVPGINNFTIRNADAVFATAWTTAQYVHSLSKAKGKKYYFIQDYEKWNSNIKLVDSSYTLPLNRIVIAKHLNLFLKEKFGSESKVIRYGLDFDTFNNPSKTFGKPVTLLYMDHQLPNKNAKAAIDTILLIKEKYPGISVKGFGMNIYNSIPDYFEFTKNPDDKKLQELYSTSDIYIYPTLFEGCPTTPLEAMACKCAVVANAAAEIPFYITNKETGILADPLKPEQLFEGVSYLINNPGELKRISQNGYESVTKMFRWDNSVNELLEFINNTN